MKQGTTGKNTRLDDVIERCARAGYATKGILYCVLGALSVQAALSGGAATGNEGAVRTIAEQPLGGVLLVLTALGLAGYAVWRFVQAALDPEGEGSKMKGVAKRIGYAISGMVHTGLTVVAVQMLTKTSGGDSKATLLATVMSYPLGQLAVALAGVCLIGVGIFQLVRAKTTEFEKELETRKMSERVHRLALASGRVGLAARGIVFPIMGIYLIRAGLSANPGEAKGVGGALQEISSTALGDTMLAVVAAGLFLYGVFQFVQARYRRIPAG